MIATKSIWEATGGKTHEYPVFTSDAEADIVIVGGGITGLTAATLLSKAGKNVILLEAKQIGMGTTGNSTGNLYATVDEHLSHIKTKWNADVMKAVVDSRKAALNLLENNIREYKIECNFSKQPFTFFAESMDKDIESFVKNEYDALKEAGLEPQILEDAGLPYRTVKGLRVNGQAQFHPLKYVRQLARAIDTNCHIYENSRVIDIDENKGVVKTEKGTVKTDKILLATHTPVGVYMIQTVLGPYREFGVASELIDPGFPGGIFWGMNQPKHSVRLFDDNGKKYVMAIGDKFKTGQHGDTHKYVEGLENYLKERLNISETKYIWGGQQYRPADGIPYIGKHSEHIYFLTGFATDGLIYGTLAAMIIADELLDRPNPWKDTFRANRHTPLKSVKEFIKENADIMSEYIKDTPWNVGEDDLKKIPNGEGKIIEKDQRKLAVYRDENGFAHVVSAVCTHMKCIVNWNQSEKTWDCPCHGSRFDISGKVIEGPAFDALPSGKDINQ